jgi:sugar phosphate isomerase/epimerase
MSSNTKWNLSAFADEAGATTQEQIAALQRAGLSHLDVRALEDFNVSELPLDVAQIAAQKFADAGIEIGMFGSPLGKIDIADDFEIDLNKLRHLAQLAPIFNCRAVRIFSYFNKSEKSHDEWKAESLRRLGALKDEAKKLGLVLYHENEKHIFGEDLKSVLAIADALRDGETFRLIFDFDNYNQGGEDVWQNWQSLKNATDAFHLKDSTKDGQHVPIGQGAGYAREILRDAFQNNWSGPLSLEPHLAHSAAVMATGPSGQANQEFKNMSAADCFQVAAQEAKKLLQEVSVPKS